MNDIIIGLNSLCDYFPEIKTFTFDTTRKIGITLDDETLSFDVYEDAIEYLENKYNRH